MFSLQYPIRETKMVMPEFREHLNLNPELVHALLGEWVPTLDCDLGGSAVNYSLVDFPKASNTKEQRWVEVIGDSTHLSKGKEAADVRRSGRC